jgi:chromosome partitioning protein
MSARVYAVCNQKGGVGKTTTAFHLARAGVRAGRRVLLVDIDPQGNLTKLTTRQELPDTHVGVADVLSARARETLPDVLVEGVWDALTVAPTVGSTLELVRDELVVAGAGREARLRTALAAVRGDFDLVLIDCPPSLDQLTINALTAADEVIVVTESRLLSTDGISKLQRTVETVRDHYNPGLRIVGAIVNKHEPHTIAGRQWLDQIAANVPVIDPVVPKRTAISDAAEAATGLDEWPSRSGEALAEIYDQHLRSIEAAPALQGAHR